VGLATAKVVSVTCGISEDIGPGHSLERHSSFNFALDDSGSLRPLALADVLRRDVDACAVLASRVASELAFGDPKRITPSLGDFFLTRDALVLTFPSYALGARAVLEAVAVHGDRGGARAEPVAR
jgi:hypothetical protein